MYLGYRLTILEMHNTRYLKFKLQLHIRNIWCDWLTNTQVPLLDGSAKEWVEAIKQVGLCVAEDQHGYTLDKLVPELHEPLYLWHGSSFLIAFPSQKICITYGIDFPKVHVTFCLFGV